MVELIYWTGSLALLLLALAVIVFSLGVIFLATKNMLIKNLASTYNHVQLIYFMKSIREKGYTHAMEGVGKQDDHE